MGRWAYLRSRGANWKHLVEQENSYQLSSFFKSQQACFIGSNARSVYTLQFIPLIWSVWLKKGQNGSLKSSFKREKYILPTSLCAPLTSYYTLRSITSMPTVICDTFPSDLRDSSVSDQIFFWDTSWCSCWWLASHLWKIGFLDLHSNLATLWYPQWHPFQDSYSCHRWQKSCPLHCWLDDGMPSPTLGGLPRHTQNWRPSPELFQPWMPKLHLLGTTVFQTVARWAAQSTNAWLRQQKQHTVPSRRRHETSRLSSILCQIRFTQAWRIRRTYRKEGTLCRRLSHSVHLRSEPSHGMRKGSRD